MENANFLVVEDSPTMRQLISFSLKRFKNAKIIEAVDGVDALKKLSGPDKIDLILTDINMPVMDGLKLVSLVRQNAQLKNIPIIIITPEGAEEDPERGLALAANAYISKPIQSSHLIKTISELLSVSSCAGQAILPVSVIRTARIAYLPLLPLCRNHAPNLPRIRRILDQRRQPPLARLFFLRADHPVRGHAAVPRRLFAPPLPRFLVLLESREHLRGKFFRSVFVRIDR